jgi:hypothetical protein
MMTYLMHSGCRCGSAGRIILYIVAIVIVIVTRLRWTKHGRKVTKQKIVVESVFYLALRIWFIPATLLMATVGNREGG